MNNSTWLLILVILVVLYISFRNRRVVAARKIIKKRKVESHTEMKELAKRFIDKECIISSFDGNHQYEGVLKEVTDGAILMEKDGKIEAINLDFVIRIREYPRNKKGKKKSVVLD